METVHTQNQSLMKAARLLERQLIEDMLKSSKIGEFSAEFAKSDAADQFSSFLRQSYSEQLSNSGKFGIAEMIFKGMTSDAD